MKKFGEYLLQCSVARGSADAFPHEVEDIIEVLRAEIQVINQQVSRYKTGVAPAPATSDEMADAIKCRKIIELTIKAIQERYRAI